MRDLTGELRLSGRRRLKGFDYTGRNAYHVATVTRLRKPLLTEQVAAEVTIQIRAAAEREDFELLAFIVMPDHVHVLVQGQSDGADLIRFVQRFKQMTGFAFKKRTREQLWQWSFYDRIVRKEEDIAAMALYIVRNPERAVFVPGGARGPWAGGCGVEPALPRFFLPGAPDAPPLLEEQ